MNYWGKCLASHRVAKQRGADVSVLGGGWKNSKRATWSYPQQADSHSLGRAGFKYELRGAEKKTLKVMSRDHPCGGSTQLLSRQVALKLCNGKRPFDWGRRLWMVWRSRGSRREAIQTWENYAPIILHTEQKLNPQLYENKAFQFLSLLGCNAPPNTFLFCATKKKPRHKVFDACG